MAVTLPVDLFELLGRTGHRWPDANEDRIVAMADGWNGLHTRLDAACVDHEVSVRLVLARNTGEAMSAYGEWARKYDVLLLRFVEVCARAEALLLAIARTVLAVKKAILDVLDALARAIEQVKQAVKNIPIVGGIIAAPIEEVIQPLLDAAREVIGEILEAVTDLVTNLIVPKLVEFIEVVKGLVQDLRKLVKGESDADWPTTPSGDVHPENRARGKPETWRKKDDPATKRGRRLENEAATALAQAGYDVEQNPSVPGSKNPDYKIEGKVFDCAAPTTADAYSIWSNIRKKKVETGQADRVIIKGAGHQVLPSARPQGRRHHPSHGNH